MPPLVNFTCPKCNRTLPLVYIVNRKFCPECSAKTSRETYMAKYDFYKANARAREKERKASAQKPAKPPVSELDANIKKQAKQCKTCKYHYKDCGYEFCDYVTWHGRLRDRGEGAGKCGSYAPKETNVKRKRDAYLWR